MPRGSAARGDRRSRALRAVERREIRQQLLDHRVASEPGRGADALDQSVLVRRADELIDHRQPEALRILLAALDGHPRRRLAPTPPSHERSSTVLPLPAGAQSRTTWPPLTLERASKSARRGTSRSMAGSRSAGTVGARPRRSMTVAEVSAMSTLTGTGACGQRVRWGARAGWLARAPADLSGRRDGRRRLRGAGPLWPRTPYVSSTWCGRRLISNDSTTRRTPTETAQMPPTVMIAASVAPGSASASTPSGISRRPTSSPIHQYGRMRRAANAAVMVTVPVTISHEPRNTATATSPGEGHTMIATPAAIEGSPATTWSGGSSGRRRRSSRRRRLRR